MFDLVIKNGLVIDGSGGAPLQTNIAVRDGLIVEVGECQGETQQTIDAEGLIVTPGFVDVHTHYDGQVSWDEELMPSVNHGVTTAVMGNCGVGFAPCDWESFPEYMDAIEKIPHTIDFAVMVPHDPLRVYAMGERAIFDQPANADEIKLMQDLVREAMQAGAIGFSTGRSDSHKTADGDWTPASEATKEELVGIAEAFQDLDYGVLQAVNDFDITREEDNFDAEFEIMEAYFAGSEKMNAAGLDIYLQVAPRAIGVFNGLNCTFHPLMGFPSYIAIRDKSLAERVEIMRDPAFKAQLLSETPVPLAGEGSSVPPMVDMMIAQYPQLAEKLFKLDIDGVVDYEQSNETSIAGQARRDGVSVWEKAYDLMLENDGKAMIYFPVFNYTEMNYDNVYTMLKHPKALPGLSDGGAHVGTICDASFPSYLLSHWTRDRLRKDKPGIALERAIQMLTADGADYLGLNDRGRLAPGLKADINIIDYENLALGIPRMVQDLPAGGQRLLQDVTGYKATFVSGQQVIADDQVLAHRPGKLVRMKAA